jgi:hypothetical protein
MHNGTAIPEAVLQEISINGALIALPTKSVVESGDRGPTAHVMKRAVASPGQALSSVSATCHEKETNRKAEMLSACISCKSLKRHISSPEKYNLHFQVA